MTISSAASESVGRWLRRHKVPGASIGILEPDGHLVTTSYGYRDREEHQLASSRTVYGIGSLTKGFFALALLRLEEDGLLSTRDPVVRHLPNFRTPGRQPRPPITLHHLLTHTSGLPNLATVYHTQARQLARDPFYHPSRARRLGIDTSLPPIDTFEQLLRFIRTGRYRMLGPPGQIWNYSNLGYALLGAVIEEVSGRAYERYIDEEILGPAGMRSTVFDPGRLFRCPEVTTLYFYEKVGARNKLVSSQEWWDDPTQRPSGGLRSNVEDMSRYLELFVTEGRVDGERILSTRSIRKMVSGHFQPTQRLNSFYGYGISSQPDYHGTVLLYHGGLDRGAAAFIAIAPKRRVAGVVLSNLSSVPIGLSLMFEINERLGLPLATPFTANPPVVTPTWSLSEYAGLYSSPGVWIRVRPIGKELRLDIMESEGEVKNVRARPVARDQFLRSAEGLYTLMVFERDSRGRVWALSSYGAVYRRRSSRDLSRARKGTLVW